MSLLVDTSVWSLAFRRDRITDTPEVGALTSAISGGELIVTTGIILQELLQGFSGPTAKKKITTEFGNLPMVHPEKEDYIQAAELRNKCRRAGVQAGTIDALIARICISHQLTLLSTDKDFVHIARHSRLKLWQH